MSKPPLPKVFLVRHGETEWSISGQHTSLTDIALTARGEMDARALAPRLQSLGLAKAFSSPLQRARRTCDLAGLSAYVEVDSDLTEWHYGEYEGVRSVDIHKERPDWNIFDHGCPGGESPAEVGARADRMIARLRRLDCDAALFSHGHFGRVLAARWVGLPAGAARHFLLNTTSLSMFTYEHNDPGSPAIGLWNAG